MGALRGKSVVVTRPLEYAEPMASALRQRGANVVLYPTLAISPVVGKELDAAKNAAAQLAAGEFNILIFTSANGVRRFLPLVEGGPVEGVRAYAIGEITAAAMAEFGWQAKQPEISTSEGLLAFLVSKYDKLDRLRVLFPRARKARTVVTDGLRERGAVVESIPLYDTLPLTEGPPLPPSVRVDWITFTSPSAVEAFEERTDLPEGCKVACIGTTTAKAAEDAGFDVDIVPDEPSAEALVAALDDFAESTPSSLPRKRQSSP